MAAFILAVSVALPAWGLRAADGGRRRSAALSMRTGITDANDDDAPDDLRHEWLPDERSLGDGAVLETHPPPRERFRRLKVKP